MRHAEFNDARLVEVYDAECPWSREDDFFVSIVNETPAARVLDLGCGTGRLAIALAAFGHQVTGVDPAAASLEAARGKPGAASVVFIEGTSDRLPNGAFDVALMTSHVAQFFVTDPEWRIVLADIHRALAPDGVLVFDARDPAAREWERWSPVESRRQIPLVDGRVVAAWTEVTDVTDVTNGAVSFIDHYRFPGGLDLVSTATLRFRSESEVRATLHDAGFVVTQIFGGWKRERVGEGDGELLVIARRETRQLSGGRRSTLLGDDPKA